MKLQDLHSRLDEIDFQCDEFGRIVIEDKVLLEYISGASLDFISSHDNSACGSNGACGNAGCANVHCKK